MSRSASVSTSANRGQCGTTRSCPDFGATASFSESACSLGVFSQPSPQGSYKEVGALDAQRFPIWQQHKEIIKTMFQFALTRVISFTFSYGKTGIHFMNHVLEDPALRGKYKDVNGNAITNPNGHHDISHNVGAGAADAQFIIDKYHCDRTADLLASLATTPDIGGGTLAHDDAVELAAVRANRRAQLDPSLHHPGKQLRHGGAESWKVPQEETLTWGN